MNYGLYYSVIEFFGRFLGYILGLLVTIIVISTTIITALDIMYITLPVVQTTFDKLLDGKRYGGFRLLSKSALLSLEKAQETGTHVIFIYLKYRLKDYIMIAIVVYILVVGPKDIINYIWNIISKILVGMGLLVG